MSFRGDDDAREERTRSLEKQLDEARREVSELRPKAARLDVAEKENKRLLAEIASLRGEPSAPSARSSGSLFAVVALFALLVAALVAWLVVAPAGPPAPDGRTARELELDSREADLVRREMEADALRGELEAERRRLEESREPLAAPVDLPNPLDDATSPQDIPTRSEIVAAMNEVRPAVEACDASSRTIVVRVTFGSSGATTSVEVRDEVDAATAACVARAVREAHVPAFTRGSFVVSYPFRT